MTLSKRKIKTSIKNLMDAVRDADLVDCQDGGVNVDIVLTRREGQHHQVMGLQEAEERLDAAIRAIWELLTGNRITGDPVGFIND